MTEVERLRGLLWILKQRAQQAHLLAFLAMRQTPQEAWAHLQDDGALHNAIHDILGVDTPEADEQLGRQLLALEIMEGTMVLSKESQAKLLRLVQEGKANEVSIRAGFGGGSTIPYVAAFQIYDLSKEEHAKFVQAIDALSV